MTTKRLSAAEFVKWCEEEFGGEPAGLWSAWNAGWEAASAQPRCKSEWIPVSDRLPEDGVLVLTHMADDPDWNGTWLQINLLLSGKWQEMCTHGPVLANDGEVTHWMVLPDAPEGDQGAD